MCKSARSGTFTRVSPVGLGRSAGSWCVFVLDGPTLPGLYLSRFSLVSRFHFLSPIAALPHQSLSQT